MNHLSQTLMSGFERTDNVARMTFCDPASRATVANWHVAAESAVNALRLAVGFDPGDQDLVELVDDLWQCSREFRDLWAANVARGRTVIENTLIHPDVGGIGIVSLAFDIRGAPGQQLIVLVTEPGSPSAASLALLRALGPTSVAGERETPVRGPAHPGTRVS
jgi:hypothetical protein